METAHHDQPNVQAPATLNRGKHVKYWTRCLKTLLPEAYTSNDSNRMYLAYFILNALDLLSSLTDITTDGERSEYARWIYSCQHPDGGFRMWPGTDFGEHRTEENKKWDPANLPATYFALCSLLALGDDLERLDRKGTLKWLRNVQRTDGSFGETYIDGTVEGGRDPRFGYCAAGVRYMLRGQSEGSITVDGDEIEDVNVDAVVSCVKAAETYDGGIADDPFHEPHAGYTFCSVGLLAFLGRLQTPETELDGINRGPSDPGALLKWLLMLQTDILEPDAELDSEFSGASVKPAAPELKGPAEPSPPVHQSPDKSTMWNPSNPDACPYPEASSLNSLLADASAIHSYPSAPSITGFSGRLNKVADTCYAFWVLGSLQMLGHSPLAETHSLKRYLLEETQHEYMGGFGKFPGDKADLYHSYLGLAALSLCGSEEEKKSWGLKTLDGGMCVSKDAKDQLKGVWEKWGLEQ
ncbi:hypothetical protein MBLNU230_g5965t1 [Neophaeotheca triangularis]